MEHSVAPSNPDGELEEPEELRELGQPEGVEAPVEEAVHTESAVVEAAVEEAAHNSAAYWGW